ncbi:MAG TPA: sensor histidine kinase [Streptosporangiaceae bacterium]|nr:sensor histidine kinase [Streptosporangiaceae bacterium]
MANDYLAGATSRPPALATLSERQWFAVCALAACTSLTALTLVLGTHPGERGQRFALALLACGPILLLRRWPLPALAAVTAATATAMAQGGVTLPLGIMLGLTAYLTASRLPRRKSLGVSVATVAALGSALAYAAFANAHAPIGLEAIEGIWPVVAAWVVGDAVATRRRYLAGLAEQAERKRAAEAERAERKRAAEAERAERERAAEAERARQEVREERVRIARELHDVVAHTLTVMTVQAGVGRRLMGKRPEEAGSALASIEAIGRTAQEELRVVLGLLREEDVEAASLAPAPRLVDLKDLVETVRDSGTPVDLRTSGTDRMLSPSLELSIYRVVQEALTNVVKHAPGASASVDVAVTQSEIQVEIANEAGAPGAEVHRGPGHGIVGMRERVGAFGGWLVAEPRPGRGFVVLARIPLEGPSSFEGRA